MNMPASIFTSNYAATGFAIALVCFFLSETIGATIIPAIRRGGARIKRTNAGSNFLVFFSVFAAIVASLIFAKTDVARLPDWVYYIGITVMFVGIALRQWAIAVLGRFFSGVIGVQKEQKVVKTGPYRLIRHPSYTGALILLVGMGLTVQSWAAILLNVTIFAIVYGHRIYVEEKVLINELGNSYVEYKKKTKRIIPKIV